MPFTWRINITPNPQPDPDKPAVFKFDQPPQIQVGDQIIWSNNDSVAHYPHPNADFMFMPNQIAPNSPSPAFAPSQSGTTTYHCCLHPGETGTIEVK